MLGILAFGGLVAAAPAEAQQRWRRFPETGFCVSGPILSYWERNGGLPVFGYPISDLRVEFVEDWSGPVQWFERDRLEDHGAQGILAGRLGADVLFNQGRAWQTFPRAFGDLSGCEYFPLTGHSLCEPFLSYWRRNGRLERFGYPITEQVDELLVDPTSGMRHPYTVQYFERRRMQFHPEYASTRSAVLLGLLGRQMREFGGCESADAPLARLGEVYRAQGFGCPRFSFPFRAEGVRAVQPFERGAMVWVRGGFRVPSFVYVIFFDNERGSLVWQSYQDTWFEGQPASGGEKAPAGLFEPIRGFGKVWRENAQVRNTLGWATAPEASDTGMVQDFQGGQRMLYRSTANRVFVLFPDGRADDVPLLP
jgi:hypothetical protein